MITKILVILVISLFFEALGVVILKQGIDQITLREKAIFTILAIAVLGMGLYPLPFSEIMHVSVSDLLVHVARSKLP